MLKEVRNFGLRRDLEELITQVKKDYEYQLNIECEQPYCLHCERWVHRVNTSQFCGNCQSIIDSSVLDNRRVI